MVYNEVVDLLTRSNIRFRIHEHQAVRTIKDAEERAPDLVENLLKTVAFRVKDSIWVLAAVRCRDRIDYSKLSKALGVSRRLLFSLSPEDVSAELGFEIGGVGPIRLREDVRVIFDDKLKDAGMIRCGSGSNTHTLELDFADLLRITEGITRPITR